MNLATTRTYAFWLAILRIYVGVFWLSHGVPKFLHSAAFMPPDGFIVSMLQQASQKSVGGYHSFIVGTVVPHIGVFAELVRLGEVLVGCSALLGLFTRLGGIGGMFLSLNYMLAKGGITNFDSIGGLDQAAFALSAINAVLPTGRILGLDGLFMRARREPVVVPEFVNEPAPSDVDAH